MGQEVALGPVTRTRHMVMGKSLQWGQLSGFTSCWWHLSILLTRYGRGLLGAPQWHHGVFLLFDPRPHHPDITVVSGMSLWLLYQDRGAQLVRQCKHLREGVGWG